MLGTLELIPIARYKPDYGSVDCSGGLLVSWYENRLNVVVVVSKVEVVGHHSFVFAVERIDTTSSFAVYANNCGRRVKKYYMQQ
jgi:hypothetical protein